MIPGKVLVINTSFQELDHLAAALCQTGGLSKYVRPYTCKRRLWERSLSAAPLMGKVYRRTFGRRTAVEGLSPRCIREVALWSDFAFSLTTQIQARLNGLKGTSENLLRLRTQEVARAGARSLDDEQAVVASWSCAAPAFLKMKQRGGLCILNYSLAHHRFSRKYLLDEAQREPDFSTTLNSHVYPQWLEEQLEQEISLADRILVGSSFVKQSFLAEGVAEDKLVVVPYGADTRLFEPSEDWEKLGDAFRVLFVGQIGQRKGISYLLRAYERFRAVGTTLTLVGALQGDGEAFIPFRGLFEHIPHVPRAVLRGIYQSADVFLFPTLVEGMPLVVLEAMASGLPVITTPNGPGDIVRDGVDGFLVPPRNVDAIEERLQFLRSNPAVRMEMAKNARLRALAFTWDVYRSQVCEKIDSWMEADQDESHTTPYGQISS